MKKRSVINLIKFYAEKNDLNFRNEAIEIAKNFNANGDEQLGSYILSLLSNANTFIPQISLESSLNTPDSQFFRKIDYENTPLPLPEKIKEDVIGLTNAACRNVGVNKFLFQGAPGTGKTETVKQIARLMERTLMLVDFDYLIDSKLGQTSKNISLMFQELNSLSEPENFVVLFDEIDALAMDRTNSNDMREMGRATTAFLKGIEHIDNRLVLIATTNLYNSFDKALIRRFDSVINFNRYTRDELLEIAEIILNEYLIKFAVIGKDIKIFKKIMNLMDVIPYPGDLKNIIKTAVAFSKPNVKFDYLKRLYNMVEENNEMTLNKLQENGFTLREIEILTGISKSQVSRILKEEM